MVPSPAGPSLTTGMAGWSVSFLLLLASICSPLARAASGDEDGGATVDVVATPTPTASVTDVALGPSAAGTTDLAGVLQTVPGTTVRRLGGLGDFAAVRLRGSTFQQVEVFLDGVPLNPNGDDVVDLSTLPVASFADMLVYRGFAPARYGSAAMGGVLDLRTTPAGASRPLSALGASAGSWGTLHSWGSTQPVLGRTDALLTLDQLHTDGDWPYFDDQGTEYNRFDDRTLTREHNRVDRANAIARVRTTFGTGSLTLLDTPAWTDEELTGTISTPSTQATFLSGRNLLVLDGDLAGTGSDVRPGDGAWRLHPRAWWLHRDETVHDPLGELAVGDSWTRGVWNTGGAQVEAVVVPKRWLTTSLLVRGLDDVYAPYDLLGSTVTDPVTGEPQGVADGSRSRRSLTAALSADLELRPSFGTITVSPVAQVDVLDNHLLGQVPFSGLAVSPGTDATEVYGVPRGAVSWCPYGPLTLRGSAGVYARPPDLTELFGDQGTIVGNTDLVAERGYGVEAGAHLDPVVVGPLTVGADGAYARQRVHDLITYEPNSQQTEHAVNLGEAYFRTVEGAAQVGLKAHVAGALLALSSNTSVTQILARNLDTNPTYSNNALPNVPPWDVSQTTSLRFSAVGLDNLVLSHTWSYTSATFEDRANEIPTAPRDLHSVALSVRIRPSFPTIEASVLNILDVRGMAVARNPLDPSDTARVVKPLTDFVGYPLPGRTVMITARWEAPSSPGSSPHPE